MTAGSLIAVIDDDHAIRTGLSSLLRSAGYDVVLFDSAEAFLASPAARTVERVVTDIQMPGMSGIELQSVLRKTRPALPVLIMTAFPEPALRDQALAGGAACFLSKPFDADELLRLLA
ncbi:response regulator transcription factor [Sphingomonas sp. CJ99]